MNVRTKLLTTLAFNVVLILGVAAVAVLIAQRFDQHVMRAELAYDQRQTITMLAVQAFHYRTAIDNALQIDAGRPGELNLARQDVSKTMQRLVRQTEQEAIFLAADGRPPDFEEAERLGMMESAFADVHRTVDRMIAQQRAGDDASARQMQRQASQRFEGDIAEHLAAAMADEQAEVAETDARMVVLAERRVLFLIAAGLTALAISLAMGILLHRTLSRPMRQLLDGVRALRSGSLQHRLPHRGADEFAELAAQFNDMAANLEDRQRRLLESQSELERQVAQRTSELEEANQRLKYLDRRRLLFLAEVSHELRTPVTVLRGEAEVTLRADPTSPAPYRDALQRIAQQAEQMGRLVDDLLFLVRSEADTLTFNLQPVTLQSVVAEAVRDGAVLARGKGISVIERLPKEEIRANADAQRLRQAILIAIDNSVKHSEAESAIEVSLSADNGRAAITVLDRGAGVPAEELPYVFERFYRIRGGAKRRAEGSGLGLPIAKWIAEKHDGRIAMSSRPGQETRFTIEIPLLKPGAP